MLAVILATLVGGFFGFRNTKDRFDKLINTVTAAVIFGLITFFIVILLSASRLLPGHYVPVREGSFQLVSTTTSSSISGSFFIFSGSISERFYYLYYWQDDSGGIHFDKIMMDSAVIHEVNDAAPRLVITQVTKKFDEPFNLFAISIMDPQYKYNFYVPVGSVNREINMSLP